MDDLHCGLLPADAADLSALEAWDICYKHMVEFVAVDYDQFKDRLRDHRRQVRKDVIRAASESDSLAHDRRLFWLLKKKGLSVALICCGMWCLFLIVVSFFCLLLFLSYCSCQLHYACACC